MPLSSVCASLSGSSRFKRTEQLVRQTVNKLTPFVGDGGRLKVCGELGVDWKPRLVSGVESFSTADVMSAAKLVEGNSATYRHAL